MQQHQSPPQLAGRIIASARGLACSTFAGVANIENELRDIATIGKQVTLPVRSTTRGTEAKHDRVRRPAHRGAASAGSSFRTKTVSFALEDEESATSPSSSLLSPKLELTQFERTMTWHLDDEVKSRLQDDGNMQQVDEHHDAFEDVWDATNVQTALRRLSQVKNHISSGTHDQLKNRSHQEYDPDEYLRHLSRLSILDFEQEQQRYNDINMLLEADRHVTQEMVQNLHQAQMQYDLRRHQQQLRQDQYQQQHQQRLPSQSCSSRSHNHSHSSTTFNQRSQAERDLRRAEVASKYSYCPSFACHTKHANKTKKIVLGKDVRNCIHLCCDFTSTTAEEWYEHLAAAHSNPDAQSDYSTQSMSAEQRDRMRFEYPPQICDRCYSPDLVACHDGADGPCTKCACGRHIAKAEITRRRMEARQGDEFDG